MEKTMVFTEPKSTAPCGIVADAGERQGLALT